MQMNEGERERDMNFARIFEEFVFDVLRRRSLRTIYSAENIHRRRKSKTRKTQHFVSIDNRN